MRSLQPALTVHIGFNPRNAVTTGFELSLHGYDEPRGREFHGGSSRRSATCLASNRFRRADLSGRERLLGKRVRAGGDSVEMVGIVEDGKYLSLSEGKTPVIFRAITQAYNSDTFVVARARIPTDQALREVQRAILDLDSSIVFIESGSLFDHLRLPLFPARLAASILGAFGGLAILLAATGIYGVVAYSVSQRTREFGIRIAIGAGKRHVFTVVLQRTAMLLAIGGILGTLAAMAVGGLFSPVLYGVNPKDPGTFAMSFGMMALVAFAASWIPARRAMGLDPLTALRQD